MIKRFMAILSIAVFWACGALAQDYRRLDSLIALSVSVEDTVLPRLYYEISWESRDVDPMLGVQYALMSYEHADLMDNRYYKVQSMNALAMNERNLGQYQEAVNSYGRALQLASEYRFLELEALAYSNLGNVYVYLDRADTALMLETTALRLADSIGSNIIRARAYMNMGLIDKKLRNYVSAIEYLEKSYFIRRDSLNDFYECLAPIGEMANIYMEDCDYESARSIINQYLHDAKFTPSVGQMQKVWFRMAQVYYKMGILDSAAIIAQQSLQYAKMQGNVSSIENGYKLLDSIYIAQGNYQKASLCCREFIDINDTVFNVALAEQLTKIRYSSQYIHNKSTIDKSRMDRQRRYHIIFFALILLTILVIGIRRIVETGRKASRLNVDMESKRAAMINSLDYAHTIQKAVFSDTGSFGESFADRFVMFLPRDIVSGDFYWRYADSRYEMLAVADCTGHGVPGAMLTMMGVSALQDIARQGCRNAGEMLNLLRQKVKYMLRLNDESAMKDGMDISLVIVDRSRRVLDFAGAFNSLMYVRNGQLNVLKATRAPIGYYVNELPFKSQYLEMELGDVYYLATDGFTSQFGGDDNSKYPHKRFRQLLLDIHALPMCEQREILIREYQEWKGNEEQVDDVTIAGFRY